MADNGGFIKLYRKMLDWEWWDDVNTRTVFIYLLLSANYKPMRWRGMDIDRGQLVTSYEKIAEDTGLSVRNVRTSLARLETTGEVTRKVTNKWQAITIEKYAFYQGERQASDKQTDRQMTGKRQASDKQTTTSKEYKEIKNIRNQEEKNIFTEIPPQLVEPFKAYQDMREQIGKPLTARSSAILLKRLNKLSGGDLDLSVKMLNEATVHNWLNVYELKDKAKDDLPAPF